MANPLLNEDELYKKIEDENIEIHPLVWELISHHIGNDLYMISLILGQAVLPANGDPRPVSIEDARKIYEKVNAAQKFIKQLRTATRRETGF